MGIKIRVRSRISAVIIPPRRFTGFLVRIGKGIIIVIFFPGCFGTVVMCRGRWGCIFEDFVADAARGIDAFV